MNDLRLMITLVVFGKVQSHYYNFRKSSHSWKENVSRINIDLSGFGCTTP